MSYIEIIKNTADSFNTRLDITHLEDIKYIHTQLCEKKGQKIEKSHRICGKSHILVKKRGKERKGGKKYWKNIGS